MTIPQTIKNIASDLDIVNIIPRPHNALEVVAAATKLARQIAGNDAPDRHAYMEAVPQYLEALPVSTAEALGVIRRDAAEALNLPGMAADAEALSKAIAKREKADLDVAAAESIQGRRLAEIQTLEKRHEELQNSLLAWDLDYGAEIATAEALVTEHYGKAIVTAPFERIQMAEVLKRLAPRKLAEIRKLAAEIEKELATLKR